MKNVERQTKKTGKKYVHFTIQAIKTCQGEMDKGHDNYTERDDNKCENISMY